MSQLIRLINSILTLNLKLSDLQEGKLINKYHDNVEDYFRITIFVPPLDDLLVHLNSRLRNGQDDLMFHFLHTEMMLMK